MGKKVFELAKDLEMSAVDLVEKLREQGFSVRNHMVALTDEEEKQALDALAPKKVEEKKTTKKVTKKKVAKKKTTVKKVTKKKTTTVANQEVEEPQHVLGAATIKRKAGASESELPRSSAEQTENKNEVYNEDRPRGLEVVSRPKTEVATPEKTIEKKAKIFQEKMHTFTPVFVPEETEEQAKQNHHKKFNKVDEPSLDDDSDHSKGRKKRIGDLAAIVNKKGAEKNKDINLLRAEEELKFAHGIVGRATYTPARKKKVYVGETKKTKITEVKDNKRVIHLHGGAWAKDLAQKLSQKFEKFANKALQLNLLIEENDYIGIQLAQELASLWNYRVEDRAFDEEEILTAANEPAENLPARNPIITIMGHVDHGKTTLLDYIRRTKVASGEAGGITQHIGAYSVNVKEGTLTFLDTPGHAAFASMRQRGANVTDVVVLVVAADDGVMPQTKESIKFIQNAQVPMIVAINKMDKSEANPDRVKQELMEFGITPEEWGGDTLFVPVSALNGDGVDKLLEAIYLQSEMLELRASQKGAAEGVVIESKIESGRGPVCTVLVQKGTLSKGDNLIIGECTGRARSLIDFEGKNLKQAGPSTPVQILGMEAVVNPGDLFNVVASEREANKIKQHRIDERKALESAGTKKLTLEDFFADTQAEDGEKKVLKLIVRADVIGSYEAVKNSIESLGNNEVGVEVIGGGAGPINDNDVMLASSVKGYILGFNMRPVTSARKLAEQKGVDIKTYSIIYELIDQVKLALEGLLAPEVVEKYIGRAQVRETFSIPKVGTIAGSFVVDGKIEKGCSVRLLREGKIVYDGKLSSLKRLKDDVKEVKNGLECGIGIENYNDVKVDDVLEAYQLEEKKRTLIGQDQTL